MRRFRDYAKCRCTVPLSVCYTVVPTHIFMGGGGCCEMG